MDMGDRPVLEIDHQLPLALGDTASPVENGRLRVSRRARARLPVIQPPLQGTDGGFRPVAGVPKTRGDCPTERPCPHVRCRHNLFLVEAETRAGRPGLASVPRDAKGYTTQVTGDVGEERAGTTLEPRWLEVRGLEIEREVKVYVSSEGLHEVRTGTLDYWIERLRIGEPVLVFDDDSGEKICGGRLEERGFVFDSELPISVCGSSSALVLTRVRGVSSCALDLAGQGGRSSEDVGKAIGRHPSLVRRIARTALEKLKAAGVDLRDVVEQDGHA